MSPLPGTPDPPYYAVIFSSIRTGIGDEEYAATAERMLKLAAQQPGYLGVEYARTPGSTGITVSYWADEASIRNWQQNAEHLAAQKAGRDKWYESFSLRIAKVERVRTM